MKLILFPSQSLPWFKGPHLEEELVDFEETLLNIDETLHHNDHMELLWWLLTLAPTSTPTPCLTLILTLTLTAALRQCEFPCLACASNVGLGCVCEVPVHGDGALSGPEPYRDAAQ